LAQAQAHQKVLIDELNHRVKNMLMVAIGIAQQTHKTSPTREGFLEAFIGRLQAMARSYELLSRENWTESSLEELISTELAPFGKERLDMEGPSIQLKPRQALSMGMVLHELSTNAGKYGALSVPHGHISIRWSRTPSTHADRLELVWSELNGPQVGVRPRRGFGLKLIEKETSYNLGGEAAIDFEGEGVKVRVAFPLEIN
jgi:two-component system CheB/CheR fusion protein